MEKNVKRISHVKRMKMLCRRVFQLTKINKSLEDRNLELVSELNNTKIALGNLSTEYNKLMSNNFEEAIRQNHNEIKLVEEERVKLRSTLDDVDINIISALKPLAQASEVLVNLKKRVEEIKSAFTDNKNPVEVKRNLAAVSPMVKGHVISNPIISLERLQLHEISAATSGTSVKYNDPRLKLSPILEENMGEPGRTRLGGRTHLQQQFTGCSPSRLRDSIPEAHAEPVVRLSDVSRLLSNTSWCNVNFGSPKENATLEASSSSPSTSTSGINIFATGTVTLRKRRREKKSAHNEVAVENSPESSNAQTSNVSIDINSQSEIEAQETNPEIIEDSEDGEFNFTGFDSMIKHDRSNTGDSSKVNNTRGVPIREDAEDSSVKSKLSRTVVDPSTNEESNRYFRNSKTAFHLESTNSTMVEKDEISMKKYKTSIPVTSVLTNDSMNKYTITSVVSEREDNVPSTSRSTNFNSHCENENEILTTEVEEESTLVRLAEGDGENSTIVPNSVDISNQVSVMNVKNRETPEITRISPQLTQNLINNTVNELSQVNGNTIEPGPSTSPEANESSRPKSKRIKKPSYRMLEASHTEDNDKQKNDIKADRKKSKKRSSRNSPLFVVSYESTSNQCSSSNDDENLQIMPQRKSARARKAVVYCDEPFSSKEMQRIFRKGLIRK